MTVAGRETMLAVVPDPASPELARTLDLAGYGWKAVSDSDAEQHAPPGGWAGAIVDVGADCRPFGQSPLTFGTFFPAPSQLTGLHGSLTSPNYPNNYNPFEQCTYIIWAPTGSNVTITYQVRTSSLEL